MSAPVLDQHLVVDVREWPWPIWGRTAQGGGRLGLARARAKGTKLGRRRVRPSVEAKILELRANGDGILKIGRKLGIGTSVVQRVFKQVPWQP